MRRSACWGSTQAWRATASTRRSSAATSRRCDGFSPGSRAPRRHLAARGWTPILYLAFTRFTHRATIDNALAIAQLLTFMAIGYERGIAMRELMMIGIERDIASSVAVLDRLPAAERRQPRHLRSDQHPDWSEGQLVLR